jgi:hypothetical protein
MQSLALNVEVLNAEGAIVTLKDEEFERDMATESMDGINLSRNESLSNDTDFTNF